MKKKLFTKNSIKQSRKSRGVTQEELAKALGVSRQTIIILEKNNYTPSLLLAFKLSNYFHEPIENLFQMEYRDQL
jgi:putative transcriptional regulator